MTAPLDGPAPGAPTPPPAPGAPAPQPAPNPSPTPPGPDPGAPVDIASLPANVQKLIGDLRKENGSHRQGRTAAEETATHAQAQRDAVLKALGINPDGSDVDDPEARAAELAGRAEQAEARIWTLGVKGHVYDLASTVGANAKLVYNSNEFRDTLDDLVDEDPDTPEFRAALEQKMREFITANPEYAGTATATPGAPGAPRPDPSQGGRGQPGQMFSGSLTDAIKTYYSQQR